MNRTVLPVGLLCSALALFLSLGAWADPAADRETDKQHLQQIWKAIVDYKKAHGHVPDYLSDLVPEFLPDKAVLISPRQKKKRVDKEDPKLPISYSYEFSARPFGNGGRTFRELKEDQMKEFGPVVPILRCFADGDPVMNIAYAGDYFESELFWEKSPAAKELSKKLGVGPGFDEGDFAEVQVVDDQTGRGIDGAEVRLTRRQYHFLPLPNRTLKTDADGKVRVPLGPAQPPSRRLTVTILKAGYYAPPETWREGALPTQKTFRLAAANTIGGLVKDHTGAPLAGANVAVFVALPGAPAVEEISIEAPESARMVLLENCATDAAGRWRCESVPKDFVELKLAVRQEAAWPAEFHCGTGEGEGVIDRGTLLAQTAEFQLKPAPVVAGVVLGPDSSPLVGEEVKISVNVADSDGPAANPSTPATEVKTDADGRFSVPWKSAGELTVSVAPKNLAVAMRGVTVTPEMEPIEIHVTVRRRITGQVHDSDGKPLPGVHVIFIGWADASVEQQITTTDRKGEFAWDAAPSDQIGLVFSADGFSPSTEWVAGDKKDALQVELRGQ